MTPQKGVADDKLGRYYRKTTAIAERLGKSLDTDTVLWVLQRIHDGEDFLSQRRVDLPALQLVSTFEMPALERFAAKKNFAQTKGKNQYGAGKAKVHHFVYQEIWDAAFMSGREGKIEKACSPTTLRVFEVNDHGPFSWNYRDYVFLAELGWHYAVGLADIWYLLEMHAAGKPTPLVTHKEGEILRRNIFYVNGRDKQLYHVEVWKQDEWKEWTMSVHLPSPGHYVSAGDRVISP